MYCSLVENLKTCTNFVRIGKQTIDELFFFGRSSMPWFRGKEKRIRFLVHYDKNNARQEIFIMN